MLFHLSLAYIADSYYLVLNTSVGPERISLVVQVINKTNFNPMAQDEN